MNGWLIDGLMKFSYTYIGIYLLVFLHENPVTDLGCAKYTKEKSNSSGKLIRSCFDEELTKIILSGEKQKTKI